jgi:hypothetical protein
MANGQRRIRPGFWFALTFVALLAYALIADWWKGHATLGWVIFGVIVAVLAFSIYKSSKFRSFVFGTAKKAVKGVVYGNGEEDSYARKPTPPPSKPTPPPDLTPNEKALFINRIGNKCENPTCRRTGDLDIHHIRRRQEGGTNSVWNLLALCRNCHGEANKGIPPRPRQFQWARNHKDERRRLLDSDKWKYR